jgi:glycosyltransferase involved in cell wall biosynthesis
MNSGIAEADWPIGYNPMLQRRPWQRGLDMTEPAISIVMAVKNAQPYIAEALDSIAVQTFSDYEVVVVDGSSTDDSLAVAASYPKVRVVRQQGTGFMGAWNEGIAVSRARYIAFLDSDDYWVIDKLACQMAYVCAHLRTDCVVGRVRFFLDPGITDPPRGFKPSLLNGSHIGYIPGTSLIRCDVFERLGLFEERWSITSDLVWFARLREVGMQIGVLDKIVLHKRVHDGNLTYTTTKQTYQSELTRLLKESIERRRPTARPGDE